MASSPQNARKPRPFPCTDVERPLTSRPFCGLLVPPDVFETSVMNPKLFGEREIKAREPTRWSCWLCEAQNKLGTLDCSQCSRPRVPDWLQLASGDTISVGNLVRLWRNKQLFVAIVTRIDYLNQTLTLHGVKLKRNQIAEPTDGTETKTESKIVLPATSGSPQMLSVACNEVEAGKVTLVWGTNRTEDEDLPLALAMCDYLLCGECGNVSKLGNGRAALDSEVVQDDKRGRLRMLLDEVAKIDNQARYLGRKWRETKTGYEELTACNEQLAAKKSEVEALRCELAPLQLWCTFCGWEWPSSRPFAI